ncbi:MAG: hypothetical protein ABIR53_08690, partial [Paraperlucidibaca sp.]
TRSVNRVGVSADIDTKKPAWFTSGLFCIWSIFIVLLNRNTGRNRVSLPCQFRAISLPCVGFFKLRQAPARAPMAALS